MLAGILPTVHLFCQELSGYFSQTIRQTMATNPQQEDKDLDTLRKDAVPYRGSGNGLGYGYACPSAAIARIFSKQSTSR